MLAMPPEATDSKHAGRAHLDALDPRLPLHARLADVVRARVKSGEWTPQHPLPAETALADHYGVALGTMRRVLGALVDEGVLERRHGAGTYVRRAKLDSPLYRFFRYGEAGHEPPSSRILGVDRAPAEPDISTGLGVSLDAEVLHLHRVRSLDDNPVLVEDIYLPLPRFAALEGLDEDDFGELLYPTYERCCSTIVASAKEILTVTRTTPDDARLLHCRRGAPLVVIERTARTHDGCAVEWRRSRGRADRFHYRIEIR